MLLMLWHIFLSKIRLVLSLSYSGRSSRPNYVIRSGAPKEVCLDGSIAEVAILILRSPSVCIFGFYNIFLIWIFKIFL